MKQILLHIKAYLDYVVSLRGGKLQGRRTKESKGTSLRLGGQAEPPGDPLLK